MATPPKKSAGTRSNAARSGGTGRTASSGGKNTAARKRAPTASRKNNTHLSTALIVGAVAAVGAIATGALLALRGSSLSEFGFESIRGRGDEDDTTGTAHQPDGADASASFAAGIADENTIPDRTVPLPG